MSVEFIGIAATAPHSETEIAPTQADPVQPGYPEELARAGEEAGFGAVTGAAGNSAAPVGSYEQVAQALPRYAGPGVSTLLIRGLTRPTVRGTTAPSSAWSASRPARPRS
jgi:hypothetical protein